MPANDISQQESTAPRSDALGEVSWVSGSFHKAGVWIAEHPRLVRWVLCGPCAFLLAVLLMMGAAHWVPEGAARVDNIVLPVALFPLIWAGVFFYALAEDHLGRAVLVIGGLTVGHVGLLAIVMT